MPALARRALLAVPALLAAPRIARAAWPDRPIQLIVPLGAGGGTDLTARTLAQYLEPELGQAIAVVNRPGAGGEIGLNAIAEARPDGYTLGIMNTPGVVTLPIERTPRFNLDSFTYLAGIVEDPGVMAVHPDSPIRDVPGLVAAARAQPGAVTVATQGAGSSSWLSVRLLEAAAGVQLEPVPYNSAPASVLGLVQRQTVVGTANLGEGMAMTSQNPWRAVGVMAESRSPLAPELPTFREQGFDVLMGSLRGLGGPKNMPPEVAARIGAAVAKVMENAEYRAACQRTSQPLRFMDAATYAAFLRNEDRRFRSLWTSKPWA
ncbi:tripartite tricarboxylate transporter substrate binding protein [Muricoccus radiodurans]|uniref:tripartite tricarboxylate transporter substrate binding protein n=1 Tax=Muricoccus radiodurans TaxID=2231721 RepID=UPI003CF71B38